MKTKDKNIFRLGLGLILLLVLTQLSQIVLMAVCELVFPSLAASSAFLWVLATVPLYLIGLPVMLLVLGKKEDADIEKKPMKVSRLLLAVVLSFGLMMIGNLIGNGIMFVVSLIKGGTVANPIEDMVLASDLWLIVLSTVVIAPIGEEFIFRRTVIDRTRRYGEGAAILISALAFALFHMNLYQFCYAFFLGLVFALIYVKTGRLRYSIILHALINFNGSVVSLGIMSLSERISNALISEMTTGELLSLALAVVGIMVYSFLMLAALVGAVIILCRSLPKLKLERGEGGKAAFLSPTVIIFAVLCLVLTFLQIILG